MGGRICPDERILSEYLSGCLREEEMEDFERHLAGCGECRRQLVEAHEVVESMKAFMAWRSFRGWTVKNRWLVGAAAAFICSFLFSRYFLQLIAACLLMGTKWIIEARTALHAKKLLLFRPLDNKIDTHGKT